MYKNVINNFKITKLEYIQINKHFYKMDHLNDLMQNLSDLNSETECDLYRPEKLLNSCDLDGVASYIKSDKCKLQT